MKNYKIQEDKQKYPNNYFAFVVGVLALCLIIALIAGWLMVYVIASLFVTDKQLSEPKEPVEITSVEVVELPDPVENGVKEFGRLEVKAQVKEMKFDHIADYVNNTVTESPIDLAYIEALYRASGEDLYLTELAVAIAYAETTLGTHPAVTTKTNFMGYDIRNGYDPIEVDSFASRFMSGLEYYRGVENDPVMASRYTGSDNTDRWLYAVNEALTNMRAQ